MCSVYMALAAHVHTSEFLQTLLLSAWLPYTPAMKIRKCTLLSVFKLHIFLLVSVFLSCTGLMYFYIRVGGEMFLVLVW